MGYPTYKDRPVGFNDDEDSVSARMKSEGSSSPTVQQQFARIEKLLAGNADALDRLETVARPIMTPEQQESASPNLELIARDRINASEYTNLVWDFANRLEHQIDRLQSITSKLEV